MREKICASIVSNSVAVRKRLLKQYPFCELRTDLCHHTPTSLANDIQLNQNVVVAIRTRNPKEAIALIDTAVNNNARFIDIDLSVAKMLHQPLEEFKHKLIISYHGDTTPKVKHLQEIYSECKAIGAQLLNIDSNKKNLSNNRVIVKIATQAHSFEDSIRVIKLYKYLPKNQSNTLIAHTMGEESSYTRVVSVLQGAPFTYCKTTTASASGQYSYEELDSRLNPRAVFPIRDDSINFSNRINPSKSLAQRAILLAYLIGGESILYNIRKSDLVPNSDIQSALSAIQKLGAKIKSEDSRDSIIIQSAGIEGINESIKAAKSKYLSINCNESGFLIRSLTAIAACCNKRLIINGKGSALKRDFDSSTKIILENGGRCSQSRTLPITIEKGITKRELIIDASSTSQDVSGYLIALPFSPTIRKIKVLNATSSSYIKLTLDVMRQFGLKIREQKCGKVWEFFSQSCKINPKVIEIEEDWSSLANLLVASTIQGNRAKIKTNAKLSSHQPDKKIVTILKSAGDRKTNFSCDCTHTPDLIPILIIFALKCRGESKIKGVKRLLNKESNRAASIITELYRLGLGDNIEIKGDSFIIKGLGDKWDNLKAVTADREQVTLSSHNDHRIAMALIVLLSHLQNLRLSAGKKGGRFFIDNIECINKSFPGFCS